MEEGMHVVVVHHWWYQLGNMLWLPSKDQSLCLKIKLTLLHSRTGLGNRNFSLEARKGGAANTGDAQDVDGLSAWELYSPGDELIPQKKQGGVFEGLHDRGGLTRIRHTE